MIHRGEKRKKECRVQDLPSKQTGQGGDDTSGDCGDRRNITKNNILYSHLQKICRQTSVTSRRALTTVPSSTLQQEHCKHGANSSSLQFLTAGQTKEEERHEEHTGTLKKRNNLNRHGCDKLANICRQQPRMQPIKRTAANNTCQPVLCFSPSLKVQAAIVTLSI